MATLRSELQTLVESPPAPPPSVADIAARATRIRRTRLGAASAGLALVLASFGAVSLRGGARPTEVVVGGGGPAAAGYVAKAPGGYEGHGDWRLTIKRGHEVIDLTAEQAPACEAVGFIRPGDEVRGWVYGEGSSLKAGENAGC